MLKTDLRALEDSFKRAKGHGLGAVLQARGEGKVLDQFSNADNPLAHYKGTGPELWRQTQGQITHFVSSMGTTGYAWKATPAYCCHATHCSLQACVCSSLAFRLAIANMLNTGLEASIASSALFCHSLLLLPLMLLVETESELMRAQNIDLPAVAS